MQKSTKKKLLAYLLTFAVVLGSMPAYALAEDTAEPLDADGAAEQAAEPLDAGDAAEQAGESAAVQSISIGDVIANLTFNTKHQKLGDELTLTPKFDVNTDVYSMKIPDSCTNAHMTVDWKDSLDPNIKHETTVTNYGWSNHWGGSRWDSPQKGTLPSFDSFETNTCVLMTKFENTDVGLNALYRFDIEKYPVLKGLAVAGVWDQEFHDTTLNYHIYVDRAADSVNVTPTGYRSAYDMTLNGEKVESGKAVSVPLTGDKTTVKITMSYDNRFAKPASSTKDADTMVVGETTYTLTLEKADATPTFTKQPKGGHCVVGQTADTLSVEASASGPLAYQWYQNSTNSADGAVPVKDATAAEFVPDSSEIGDTYYFCRATNTAAAENNSADSNIVKYHVHIDPTPVVTLKNEVPTLPEDTEGWNYNRAWDNKGYVYNIDDEATPLEVTVSSPIEGATFTYKWGKAGGALWRYTPDERPPQSAGTITNPGIGATNKPVFTPPTKFNTFALRGAVTENGELYRCDVSTVYEGTKYTGSSQWVYVYTKADGVQEVTITRQPVGSICAIGVKPKGLSLTAANSLALYNGKLTYQWYHNTVNSIEGAEPIEGATDDEYAPDTRQQAGSDYYFCRCTRKLQRFTTYTDTNVVEVKFQSAVDFVNGALKGEGTQENPFLISKPEDFTYIQTAVDQQGYPFSGVYFRMTEDITLPDGWTGIGGGHGGGKGPNLKPFSGTLNGDGHTLTVPRGCSPLLKFAREATIENLNIYGEYIPYSGLLEQYIVDYGDDGNYNTGCPEILTARNVTIKEGTTIRGSGFLSGYASGANIVNIVNCTAEKGVRVGYDLDKDAPAGTMCGSFAADFNGYIVGCHSSATVYGGRYVGGIVGGKGQTMGPYEIYNCYFDGDVIATGDFVGGIAGGGYAGTRFGVASAPMTPCATIENCYVTGTVTGADHVGGVFGGEEGSSGAVPPNAYIRNNHFAGKMTVTGEEGTGGAIIGYMNGLSSYNVIENNYYIENRGAETGIGLVNPRVTSFDMETTVNGKLARKMTAEQFADTTVTKLLNEGEGSFGNWTQSENGYPVFGEKPVAYRLAASGEYQNEYYVGDQLNLDGIVLTATWSDGSTSHPDLKDIEITGYDRNTRGVQTLTLTYDHAKTEIKVTVLKRPTSGSNTIRVSFSLLGDTIHGDPTDVTGTHTLTDNNLETWIPETQYIVDINATVRDVVEKALADNGLTCKNPSGNYIQSITYTGKELGEFSNGKLSGWMYTLNGSHPTLGVAEQYLDNGDRIVFHYTDDYTKEEGTEHWNTGGGSAGAGTVNADDQDAANAVIDQIKSIGTVTKDSGDKITAARSAYDKLTEAQKKLVTNYGTLTDAERAYAGLTGKLPFTDVNGHWAYDAIKYAYENSLFAGTSATTFGPNVSMNRAMLVTVLYRLDKEPSAEAVSSFKDVPAGQWYTKAVAWASANKIVSGYDADTFGPTDTITREQMASILYRYAQYKDYDVSKTTDLAAFTDKASVSDWALTSMQWANAEKLINGRTATTLVPQGNATRAEVAQILMTFAQNIVK